MRAQTFGWIEKEAPYDGLLIQTPEGPELIPADVVIATYPQLVAAVKKRNGKK